MLQHNLKTTGSVQFISITGSATTSSLQVDATGGLYVAPGGSGGSAGHTIQDSGSSLAARTNLNFYGNAVSASDNSGDDSTEVFINTGSGAHTIQDSGSNQTARGNLNFIGPKISDDSGGDTTVIDFRPVTSSITEVTTTSSLVFDLSSYKIKNITVNAPISESIFQSGTIGETYYVRFKQGETGGYVKTAELWESGSIYAAGDRRRLTSGSVYEADLTHTASADYTTDIASWSLVTRLVGDNSFIASIEEDKVDIMEIFVEDADLYLIYPTYDA